jgi:hypothetical protein
VAVRRHILLFFSAIAILVLAGCGGGAGTANVQNPTAPASTPVSIAFQPAPPTSVSISSTVMYTAVVSNDPTNAGVDWALVCPSVNNCGTLSAQHTQSGAANTYTPSTSSTGNSQTVTIEAFATADHSKNVLAPLTITGFAGNLKGNYVFQTQGVDVNGAPFQLAGVVAIDSNGNITGGEQTHADFVMTYSDPITGGSYTLGPDGRGTMTINTNDQNIGQLGIENFVIVFLSSSQAFLATLDNPNLPQLSSESSSGIMDLQTATAAPTGGYAFAVNGTDISLDPLAIGGIMNINSPNTISGTGSIADQDDAGTVSKKATLSGTTTQPDSFGSLQFTLTMGFAPTPVIFTGYIVDGTHIKLIESDNTTGAGYGATGGIALSQGAATGTFTKTSFAGTYVFGILGQDFNGGLVSLGSVGYFTADDGKLNSGYNDEYLYDYGDAISDSFTATYTVDSTKDGRADASLKYTTSGPGPELIFYLTGAGSPALVVDFESQFGSVGKGIAYPQATPPLAFNGPYGLYFTQAFAASENDGTGQMDVSGSAGTLTGAVDENYFLGQDTDQPLTGTFGAIPTTGRVTGTLTSPFFPSAFTSPTGQLGVAYYLIDSGHGFFIETDSLLTGAMTYGYFATRTPLCTGCP